MKNRLISIFLALFLFVTSACASFNQISPAPDQNKASKQIQATRGGRVQLPDSTSLTIPPNSLPADAQVTLEKASPGEEIPPASTEFNMISQVYHLDLGGKTLSQPAELEIPFDPGQMPANIDPAFIFLSYYDEPSNRWMYAGGDVDLKRNVVTGSITHASIWTVHSFNMEAWLAALKKILSANILDIPDIQKILADECTQVTQQLNVDKNKAKNVVQGCIISESNGKASVRVRNIKSYYVEIRSLEKGYVNPSQVMLGPGDDYTFDIDLSDTPPVTIAAEFTTKASVYVVGHMILDLLPFLNETPIDPKFIKCVTERFSDASNFLKAADYLIHEKDGTKAAGEVVDFMLDKDKIGRLSGEIEGCSGQTIKVDSKWFNVFFNVLETATAITQLTGIIITAFDEYANYFTGNSFSEITFLWKAPTPTPQSIANLKLPYMNSVFMVNKNDGWAVGSKGTILHWTGSDWVITPSPTTQDLASVVMVSGQEGWIVGGECLILHWDGTTWIEWKKGTLPKCYGRMTGITAFGANDLWVAGSPFVAHWDGTGWNTYQTGVTMIHTLSGVSTTDLWAGGFTEHGSPLSHWDGYQWNVYQGFSEMESDDVSMISEKDGWATNNYGLLHWNGQAWKKVDISNKKTLHTIMMISPSMGWAAGEGIIYQYNGKTWKEQYSSKMDSYQSMYALAADDAWIVGSNWDSNNGFILHWDGSTWAKFGGG